MELLSRPETANDRSDEPSRRDFPRAAWPKMLGFKKAKWGYVPEIRRIYWDYM